MLYTLGVPPKCCRQLALTPQCCKVKALPSCTGNPFNLTRPPRQTLARDRLKHPLQQETFTTKLPKPCSAHPAAWHCCSAATKSYNLQYCSDSKQQCHLCSPASIRAVLSEGQMEPFAGAELEGTVLQARWRQWDIACPPATTPLPPPQQPHPAQLAGDALCTASAGGKGMSKHKTEGCKDSPSAPMASQKTRSQGSSTLQALQHRNERSWKQAGGQEIQN